MAAYTFKNLTLGPGWWQGLATLALFLTLDLMFAYAVEPMAIGRRTGVSSIAMVVTAIFWAWLWGPAGLVLSTPLTVCLAVLGRQVPRLEPLAVLLGDEPALEADLAFYQRLLARDDDEATTILDRTARATSRERAFDTMVVPALVMAERDRSHGDITDADHDDVLRTIRALLADQDQDQQQAAGGEPAADGEGLPRRRRLLGVPARTATDEIAWGMLAQLFDAGSVTVASVGADALASEVSAVARERTPHLVCLVSVPPGGLAQLRYLCKRLRAIRPEARILVVRLGATGEVDKVARELEADGASAVATTLADAHARAAQLLLLSGATDGGAETAR